MARAVEQHQPCTVCDSSDAMSVYHDEDTGKVFGICYSVTCPSKGKAIKTNTEKEKPFESTGNFTFEKAMKYWEDGHFPAGWRGISEEAYTQYMVGEYGDIILFPYTDPSGNIEGFKVRFKDKKEFFTVGKVKDSHLFGRQLVKGGGKSITITEGEFDAVAVYNLFGNKYDVVSIPLGSKSAKAACKANYDLLNGYKEIVLSFDMDEPGQVAAKEVAELFPGKVRIMKMGQKDANDYLINHKKEDFVTDWWNAPKYIPDGIISGKGLWDRINQPIGEMLCPFPWAILNDKLFGIYPQRIYTFTGGSGIGKSQITREIVYHVWKATNLKVGVLFLEEGVEDSTLGFMSLHLNKPLHFPGVTVTLEEKQQAFNELYGSDRIYFHDHFGSTLIDNIHNRIEYMIRVLDCKVILLDHLSIVISGQSNPDERKAIDELMTKLRTLVQSTGATLVLVSHLSKHSKKVWTKGHEVSGHDLRGSASIEQLSDSIIAVERNLQADSTIARNTSQLRVLKNRRFGLTGVAGTVYYDPTTGRMVAGGKWEEATDLEF